MKEFIEKLIGRLEEYKNHDVCEYKCSECKEKYPNDDCPTEKMALDKAIEIVNQLAEEYKNDFCEWFKYDYRTIAPKRHDAENPYWRIPENLDKLKFCPYCGKKIKIAPYQPKGE